MTPCLQSFPEFQIIVDLTVEDNLKAAAFVPNGLVATLQINDRQTAHPQSRPRTGVDPFVIRPPVHQ